jgi:hypothetical protein
MSVTLNINGTDYFYPEQGDIAWGPDATDWASAVTSGMLQKAGGLFQLLAEVDFGANHGLKSAYYKSRTNDVSSTGTLRLARTDVISWRNEANDGDLVLSVNSSNELLFNGSPIGAVGSVSNTNSINLALTGTDLTADLNLSAAAASSNNQIVSLSIENDGLKAQIADSNIIAAIPNASGSTTGLLTSTDWTTFNSKQAAGNYITALTGDVTASGPGSAAATIASGVIVNSMVSASAAIAYSKLALTGSIVNADVNASAAIEQSKLALSITNSEVNASAAIALTKLAAMTASRAVVSDASGFLVPSTTTATEIGYVNGVTSSIQTQLNGKQATGNYVTSLTGDVTGSGPGATATTIANAAVSLAKMANLSANSIIGNNTGSPATPIALSTAQTTAMLDDMVGDSGSGGTKGLVPAPGSGDAAANKFLKADGTWATTPSGFSNPMTTEGDLILATTAGAAARLPIGSNTYVLTSNGTTASWQAPSGGSGITQLTGDVTAGPGSGSQAATIAAGVITNSMISASAAIAFSKLAPLSSGRILVGNASNVATDVAVTGDVTISNSGVTAIGSGVIVNADISASAAIAYSKLANGSALSVLGRSSNSSGANASIAAGTNHHVLRRSGTSLGFGLLTNDNIDSAAAIAVSKLAAGTNTYVLTTVAGVPTWAAASGGGGVSAIDADETKTVGSGGDYATVEAALEYFSNKYPAYVNEGFTAQIRLLTGFTWTEQIIVKNVDLGWIYITSVDATVPVDTSGWSITMPVGGYLQTRKPMFGATNGTLPTLVSTIYDFNDTASAYDVSGIALINGKIQIEGTTFREIDGSGADIEDGSVVTSIGTVQWKNCANGGIVIRTGSSYNHSRGVFTSNGHSFNGGAIATYNGFFNNNSTYGPVCSGSGGGIYCSGGAIQFQLGNAQVGGSPASSDITCYNSGIVYANGATGGVSKTANVVNADGIIIK